MSALDSSGGGFGPRSPHPMGMNETRTGSCRNKRRDEQRMSLPVNTKAEWLEADGLGGFASGTAAGIRTRRYHALLLTAATPPTGRVVLVNGFDAWAETPACTFNLSSQHYAPDVIH